MPVKIQSRSSICSVAENTKNEQQQCQKERLEISFLGLMTAVTESDARAYLCTTAYSLNNHGSHAGGDHTGSVATAALLLPG